MPLRDKIRFNLANRLSLVFFSVFALAVAIIYLYVVPPLENRLTGQKLESLGKYADRYTESIYAVYNQGASPFYLDLLAQQYAEQAGARILIMDSSGNLAADSFKGQAFSREDYPVADSAMSQRQLVTESSKVAGRTYGMAALPIIDSGGSVDGVVIVTAPLDDVESTVSLVQRQLLIAAAVALALSLAAIYLVSYTLGRRIRRIEKGAVRIAQGDFVTRVEETSSDELGQLAGAFNEMGDRLGAAFKQVDMEKRRAKLLLDDLSEGVIGIDAGGDIIVANPAAETLLGREIEPPLSLESCVPEEIYELWTSLDARHAVRDDIFMLSAEEALQVHCSWLSDQAELVSLMVLRDVSQEVKLERSRRDFIANASHELKTPLFSLAGFLEILRDEDVDEATRREFLETMGEQVDRLTLLARDLLDLSRIDSGAVSMQLDRVELREVMETVAREFTIGQAGGAARVDTSGISAGLAAHCDRDRIVQLVRILLDNALKYSPPSEPVMVTGANGDEEGTVVFRVSDRGAGIPAEEQPRIFERFYRSKSAGRVRGTGLGLAIARELVKLMEGSIAVESSAKGTTFTITLPANGALNTG